ncbi:MAG: glycosyltransferase [Clostridia bacterium]|nr:glycosyltransferase [Clostridia bacterium]
MSKRKVLMTASVWVHIRNFHLPYLREFQRLGWEIHVGCAGIPDGAPHVDSAIALPFEKRMASRANLRAMGILRRRIRQERYDLIITHTTLAAFFTRLAVKGMRERPKVVNVMHGYLFDDDTPAVKRQALLTAEKLTAPQTDLLLVMNAWDDRTARKYRLGRRIERIPGMGVDFSRLDAAKDTDGKRLREALNIPPDAFVLLCAAEFSPRKSQQVLIEAMRALPQSAVLVLCGTGATLKDCRARARELGVSDRVRFPGQVDNMPDWYRMADACVAASRSEGLPFNIIEAMHAALPVVASAVKGHVDLIEDGVSGLLYPYADAEALAAAVRRLMADSAACADMGRRARLDSEDYALQRVFPAVMDRYLSALDGP